MYGDKPHCRHPRKGPWPSTAPGRQRDVEVRKLDSGADGLWGSCHVQCGWFCCWFCPYLFYEKTLFVCWTRRYANQLQWSQLQSWSVYVYDMWLHMQKQILILINTSTKFWKYRGVSRMTESVARCNKNYVVLSILQRSLQLIAGGSSNVRSRDSSSLGPTRSLFTEEQNHHLSPFFWTSPGFIWCHFSCLISQLLSQNSDSKLESHQKICASQVWFRHSW